MWQQAWFVAAVKKEPACRYKFRNPDDWRIEEGANGDDRRDEWAGRRGTGVLAPECSRWAAVGDPRPPGTQRSQARRGTSGLQQPGAYLD